jgi:hypothetical protein
MEKACFANVRRKYVVAVAGVPQESTLAQFALIILMRS